jgi:putative acetyltransferase
MTEFMVRPEDVDDHEAIYSLNVAAFDGRTEEADLVDALREDGDLLLSLVAIESDEIVGHVAFSRVIIETPGGFEGGVVLAPVGVSPDHQRREVGSRLIETGLEALRRRGETVVLVVGNPAYYTRFGFSVETGNHYPNVYSGSHFMAMVVGDVTDPPVGTVSYPEAFALVS